MNFVKFVKSKDAQLILNLYCNNKLNFHDASCCSQPKPMSILQQIMFTFFFISFLLAVLLFAYKKCCSNSSKFKLNISGSEISFTSASCKNSVSSIGFINALSATSKLALIMIYFYACDRWETFGQIYLKCLKKIFFCLKKVQIFSWKKINITRFSSLLYRSFMWPCWASSFMITFKM